MHCVSFSLSRQIILSSFRLILSSASPLLASLCSLSSRQAEPLLFLRGLATETLAKLVEFIYLGQVKIPKHQVEAFFKIAQEFQIKGLENRMNVEEFDQIPEKAEESRIVKDVTPVKNTPTKFENVYSKKNAKYLVDRVKLEQKMENCNLGKIEEKCPLCDKVFYKKCWIKYHIRAAHPEVSAPKEKYKVTHALHSKLKDSTGPYIHRLLNKFEVKKH